MPLTKLQSDVLRVLSSGRSLDSYIAGGVAINRDGPRFSADIDIFQNSEDRLASAADEDVTRLEGAAFGRCDLLRCGTISGTVAGRKTVRHQTP